MRNLVVILVTLTFVAVVVVAVTRVIDWWERRH
jgi:hypothetical protein